MTTNKSLKRAVRGRMAKTGERYTAARRQMLAKTKTLATDVDVAPKPEPTAGASDPSATTEPLHGPTGKPWSEWVRVLDEWGGRDRSHAEIVRWLTDAHDVAPWWRQDITVRYEKHIGRRILGQRGKTFSATATKTIAVPADVARAAWLDEARRARWLSDVTLKLRPNKVQIAKRFDVNDDEGRLIVSFDPKSDARVLLAIEHENLPDAAAGKRWTAFWRERLSTLKELLESDHASQP